MWRPGTITVVNHVSSLWVSVYARNRLASTFCPASSLVLVCGRHRQQVPCILVLGTPGTRSALLQARLDVAWAERYCAFWRRPGCRRETLEVDKTALADSDFAMSSASSAIESTIIVVGVHHAASFLAHHGLRTAVASRWLTSLPAAVPLRTADACHVLVLLFAKPSALYAPFAYMRRHHWHLLDSVEGRPGYVALLAVSLPAACGRRRRSTSPTR